ncbi:16S rRNA (guanine(966)-N(2))-methyltransferase RsmD [Oceaniglobus indicus]|uniref:16S rRNA (guanine(966)-N(2))-methyltransferase RsmD n=1 Tax=Oceaniglobus indicus TaxID=2047749 RepID=UPI000C194D7B|nr:16S rRNA (guanine(966)-N(2))-methyltransferase RsmD [Oceaniglobus indicus]
MRIIGGRMRGTHLTPVGEGDAAAHLRPTTDRVRESLFNLLVNGGYGAPLHEARVLDLFAGTGALGLEALSRGATHVTFVENGRAGQRLIAANIAKCRAQDATAILKRDATRLGPNPGAPFDVVLMDPPYGTALGAAALASALDGGWIAAGGLVVWEDATAPVPPPGLVSRDRRRYGSSVITILERGANV